MLNKLLFLIVAIIILSLFIFYSSKPEQPKVVTAEVEIIKVDSKIISKELLIKQPENNHTKTATQVIQADVEVSEIIYDSDPVVDASLVIKNHRLCYSLIGKNVTTQQIEMLEQKLDKKQLDYYHNYKNYCQQLHQQHPEYSLTDYNKIRLQKEKAIASSYWGQIIKGEVDANSLTDHEILTLLKQNNLAILSDAPHVLKKYFQEVIHWELEDVLQNHQYDYTNHIRHYAHQFYLCELGAECQAHSTIMAMLCFQNPDSCGLDYQQYIQDFLTVGQQADIALTLGYLKTKFQ